MKKKELIYRQLLLNPETTQLELSKTLRISLSTVNNAIQPLRSMGAIQVSLRKLRVVDKEKLLLFWASIKNLQNHLLYKTRVEMPVDQLEKNMPPKILFTAYTGYKFRYKDVPADYSEVYVYTYGKGLDSITARFPESEKVPNLFVLEADKHLVQVSKNNIVPDYQIFVDLWNLPEWYAKEFIIKLKERIL
ncbi:MAG: winged helix-turn-helix domain-containing protein [Thermoplasmata archaeon]|nr:MAG: winged helix-turn-helix domain-containing protein [Thermoplasmata archaeon]